MDRREVIGQTVYAPFRPFTWVQYAGGFVSWAQFFDPPALTHRAAEGGDGFFKARTRCGKIVTGRESGLGGERIAHENDRPSCPDCAD